MINQPGCIVWSGLGLELKLVSLFSNNQVNSGAKTKAADLWGSRGGWTYHLFTPRHAPWAPWAPCSTLATQHDGWTFYLRSRNGLSHTSHISHLSGHGSAAPPQPVNQLQFLVLIFSNCKVRPRYLSQHLVVGKFCCCQTNPAKGEHKLR